MHMFPMVSKTKQICIYIYIYIYIETSQFYPLDMNEILDLIVFLDKKLYWIHEWNIGYDIYIYMPVSDQW